MKSKNHPIMQKKTQESPSSVPKVLFLIFLARKFDTGPCFSWGHCPPPSGATIETLGVRMERHSKNGAAVAHFLRGHPAVKKVYWPGFEDHPPSAPTIPTQACQRRTLDLRDCTLPPPL